LSQSAANSGSADFRLGIWKIAGEAMRSKPLFGYGPGDFLTAYREVVMAHPDLFQGYLGFGAHNSFFELAAEIGVLGGVLFFVVAMMYATRGLFIAARRGVSRDVRLTALALSSALIGLVANTFTSNTFQHPQSGLFFWILSGVVAALGAGVWSEKARAVEPVGEPSLAPIRTSVVARWVVATRNLAGRMWRGSRSFEWTAEPRAERAGGWFSSSVIMRLVFGTAHGRKPQGR
jgi:O-antigen ligase